MYSGYKRLAIQFFKESINCKNIIAKHIIKEERTPPHFATLAI